MATLRITTPVGVRATGLPAAFRSVARIWHVKSADPTFALIERHRAAYRAYDEAFSRTGGDAEPEGFAADADMQALLAAKPTTLHGLRACAEYLDQQVPPTWEATERSAALSTIVRALRGMRKGGVL